jgi:pimeloyl-ACP methyl ester carboxylesterase
MAIAHDPASLLQTRLHYQQWGTRGPRVLLVHAIGFDHRSWELIVPALADRYQVTAVDLPGHGESDKPVAVDYGLRAMGARVASFLGELGWEDAVLVGNSIGGGTSLATALQAPERVRALALLNSVAYRTGLPYLGRLAFVPVLPLVGCYAPSLFVHVGLESVRGRWGSVTADRLAACNRYLRAPEGRGAFFQMLRQLYGPDLDSMEERYRDIHCPTLVLHGDRDPLIGLRHAEELARTLPNAEFVRIPGCGHFPQEECPEAVLPPLLDFLDRVTHDG